MKRIAIALLLAGAAMASVSLWGANPTADSQVGNRFADSAASTIPETKGGDTTTNAPEVIAYYFHTTYRCVSCKKIEAYSREAIETGFTKELENGTLKFESINIDESDNKHFVKDYQLYTKSLVICDMKGGKQVRWKNLIKVWELVGNKDEFFKYVQDEINAYLKES